MIFSLDMVTVPVSDVDRAKVFYADRVGFAVEQDVRVYDEHRSDADEAQAYLRERGVEVSAVQTYPWGRFCFFSDPDAQRLVGARADPGLTTGRRGRRVEACSTSTGWAC